MEAILTELDVLFLADFLKAKRITHPLVLLALCKTEEEVVIRREPVLRGCEDRHS